MKLIVRLLINAVALWAAAQFVTGIDLTGDIGGILFVAILFGIVNALIKPLVKLLSLPLTLITLGLFTLVINAFMLQLTAWLSSNLTVSGFVPALGGAIVISIVSWLLSTFLGDDDK